MHIGNSNAIDAIGTDRESREVVLSIFDHLEWRDAEHIRLLGAKLNSYFAFIESGELAERYPRASDGSLRIDVVCQYPPDQEGELLLVESQRVAAAAGWKLTWRVVPMPPNKSFKPTPLRGSA